MEDPLSEPIDWLEWFDAVASNHALRKEYVGLILADAVEEIGFSHQVRVIDTNELEAAAESGQQWALTSDLRSNRVNLLAQDRVVIAAATF
jgi:hypothetical protein